MRKKEEHEMESFKFLRACTRSCDHSKVLHQAFEEPGKQNPSNTQKTSKTDKGKEERRRPTTPKRKATTESTKERKRGVTEKKKDRLRGERLLTREFPQPPKGRKKRPRIEREARADEGRKKEKNQLPPSKKKRRFSLAMGHGNGQVRKEKKEGTLKVSPSMLQGIGKRKNQSGLI